MLLRRAPRLVLGRQSFGPFVSLPRHTCNARFLSTKRPLPPPIPDNSLSLTDQIKADIADAQTRGVLERPPADAGTVRRFAFTSVQLFKFYWNGCSTVFSRIRVARNMPDPPTTRAQLHFLYTQRSDLKKLLPFVFFALLAEEVIPILVLYAPSLLPSTCILPMQKARIDVTRIEKARAAQQILATMPMDKQPGLLVKYANGALGVNFATGSLSWLSVAQALRRYDFLARDDFFFLSGATRVADLEEEELSDALLLRGLVVSPSTRTSLESKRELLQWWMDRVLERANGAHTSTPAKSLQIRVPVIAEFARVSTRLQE